MRLHFALVLSLGAFLAEPSAQDECSSALPINEGLTSGTNVGATTSSPTGSCGLMGSDVWYVFTPASSGMATASFCSGGGTADYDTVLAAFSGSCGSLSEITCNDDTCGLLSQITFSATSGQPVYIAVGGFAGDQGNFTLFLDVAGGGGGPAGDECTNAAPISEGLTMGTNVGATTSAQTGSCGLMGNDVWYVFTSPATGQARASFCQGGGSATYDTVLAAFSGSCGSLSEIACNDDTCGLSSEILFSVTAGQQYYIAVGGFAGATGSYTLHLTTTIPIRGDECTDAIPIVGVGHVRGSNIGATTSAPTGSCGAMGSDVWYAWTATCSGNTTVSFCAPGTTTTYDPVLAVFSGSCGSLTEIACNDDTCGLMSEVSFAAVEGQQYFIAVGGFASGQGNFVFSIACGNPLPGDNCATALILRNGLTTGSTVGMTTSIPTGRCGLMGNELWYMYEATCNGELRVSFCDPGATANFDPVLAAFFITNSGAPGPSGRCSGLVELVCNDDTCGLLSEITFPVQSGKLYTIAVGGFAGSVGDFTLSTTCTQVVQATFNEPRFQPVNTQKLNKARAAQDARIGTPPNVYGLLAGTSDPVIGGIWTPVVSHTKFFPGAVGDFLLLGRAPGVNLPSPIGTVLVDLTSVQMVLTGAAGDPFAVPIPNVLGLVGAKLVVQAGSFDGTTVQLTNALDVKIGSR